MATAEGKSESMVSCLLVKNLLVGIHKNSDAAVLTLDQKFLSSVESVNDQQIRWKM